MHVKVKLSDRAISCVGVKLGNAILPQNVADYKIFNALKFLFIMFLNAMCTDADTIPVVNMRLWRVRCVFV